MLTVCICSESHRPNTPDRFPFAAGNDRKMLYASAKTDLEERMKTNANAEIFDLFAASRDEVEKGLGTQEDGDLFDSDDEPDADLFDSDDEVAADASPSGAANAIELDTSDNEAGVGGAPEIAVDVGSNDNDGDEVQKQWL